MLKIEKKLEEDTLFVALEGWLDTAAAPELENALRDSLDEVNELVLDFEKLEYIASSGLRVLLYAHKAMLGKGGMKVIHVRDEIQEIFDVTGFTDILNIE